VEYVNKKLFIIFFFVISIFSCKKTEQAIAEIEQESVQTEIIKAEIFQIEAVQTEAITPQYSLTLMAAGDNLFHRTIIRTHRKEDTYDFSPIYSEIKSLIENADLAFINQETVMAGEEFDYSGYPLFNTPQALARNLADTGFDIVNHANNHAMDMGETGLCATLDLWNTIPEITVIGARKEGESARIVTKNNITLGFLSYTYALNGFSPPASNPNLVSLINRRIMTEEINNLRPLCDFLVVSMHWGDEYTMEPVKAQKDMALFIAEHNVDLIIGHHPHVLQKAEKLPRPDGKETLCFYSLGNLVSNQTERERVLGALMLVTFVKDDDLYISSSGLIPVICHFRKDYTGTKIYPVYLYTDDLLKKHFLYDDENSLSFEFINSVLSKLNTGIIGFVQ